MISISKPGLSRLGKCYIFRINLPFKNLSDRANTLVDVFNDIDCKLVAFKEGGYLNDLTEQDKQAFELLREFANALFSNCFTT
jgi:hypothetical protein